MSEGSVTEREEGMQITPASHLDHNLAPAHVDFIRAAFGNRTTFFLETIELPQNLPDLPCNLHGPATGQPPVLESEVTYAIRGGRKGPSRLCARPSIVTRLLTVIGGIHEGECILFTAYGGPCAPREVWDETLDEPGREISKAFWAEHALGVSAGT